MAKLTYSAIVSLDGYVEDEDGRFDWAEPDAEVHAFVNELVRGTGTHLYGRKMYETMAAWETDAGLAAHSEVTRDFAGVWQAAEKVVYSRTLERVWTARTRLEREFEPEAVRALKESASGDTTVGGAELASHAFRAGLVDECHLFVAPAVVGGGKRALPESIRLDLELMSERRFEGGMVHLHYALGGDRGHR